MSLSYSCTYTGTSNPPMLTTFISFILSAFQLAYTPLTTRTVPLKQAGTVREMREKQAMDSSG